MKQYLDLLRLVMDTGSDRSDRTGTGTRSVFGTQTRYNLEEGFPAVTTKKLAWKTTVSELLWFIEGSSSNDRLKEILHGTSDTNKNTIWTANANAPYWKSKAKFEGDLGRVYGQQWRHLKKYLPQPYSSEYIDTIKNEKPFEFDKTPTIDRSENNSKKLGKVVNTDGYGSAIIIKERDGIFECMFRNTGYIATGVTGDMIRDGNIIDPYAPIYYRVGYVGDARDIFTTDLVDRLLPVWQNILSKCYNMYDPEYMYYGSRGTIVAPRWWSLSNFIHDVQKIDGWIFKDNFWDEFVLDKDFYGANLYSRDTSTWLSRRNQEMLATGIKVRATSITSGEVVVGMSAEDLQVTLQHLSVDDINGVLPMGEVGGWKIEKYEDFQPYIRIDQLSDLIRGIKVDPFGRRHIISSWNPAELNEMALPPCHTLCQFSVSDNKLSCQLYQRSGDIFLGVPLNIASYSLLTHMVAQVCGLQVGEFIHTIGDAHIYMNHFEQVGVQLGREPYELPKLKLNPRVTDIDRFTIDDCELENYVCHPVIKADMAV